MVQLGVFGKVRRDLFHAFPSTGKIALPAHFLGAKNRGFDGLNFLENSLQFLFPIRVQRDGGHEARLIVENLPVILLAEQRVEIIQRPRLHVALVENFLGELGERRIQRPQRRRGAQFFLQRFLVIRLRGIPGGEQVHFCAAPGAFDHRLCLCPVEILRDLCNHFDHLFGGRVVLRFHRREQLIRLLRELEREPFFRPRQGADFGHEFADRQRLGEPLRAAFQLAVFHQIFIRLHPLPHIADCLIGQRIERAHGRRRTHAFFKKILGVLAHRQLRVAIAEYGAVKARGDEHVLVAPLEK